MKNHKYSETVEIFAGTSWQAEMVKSLLESAEIKAYLKDDILGTISPWWVSGGGGFAVKVVISVLDIDKAKPIVDEYQKNLKDSEE